MPGATLLLRPSDNRIACKVRPIVTDHVFRIASFRDDPIKLPNIVTLTIRTPPDGGARHMIGHDYVQGYDGTAQYQGTGPRDPSDSLCGGMLSSRGPN